MPRCDSTAPLGGPVVPDVYWIWAGSPGLTSGSSTPCPPPARNSYHWSKYTTSRRPPSSGRRVLAIRSSGTSRYSRMRKSPAAWLSASTCRASDNRSAGLTVTRVSPASAAPNSSTTHSGMLLAHTATRSPGPNRRISARPTCSDSASKSANVQRRRAAGSGSPAISATSSGAWAAAHRSRPPTVCSSTRSSSSGTHWARPSMSIAHPFAADVASQRGVDVTRQRGKAGRRLPPFSDDGNWPMTTTTPPTEATTAVQTWLTQLDQALTSGDAAAAANLFTEDCFWRDLVAFTWNIRTFEGRADVAAMLAATLDRVQPTSWKITDGEEPAEADGVTEAWIEFETSVGRGRGQLRLRGGQAWTLLTTLYELKGYEEAQGGQRPKGAQHGASRDRTSWQEDRDREATELGFTEQPYVLIVGGGQAGLGLAAPAAPAERPHHRHRQARPARRPVAQPVQEPVPARPGLVRPHAVPEVPGQLAGVLAQGQDRRLARVLHPGHGAQLLAQYRSQERLLQRPDRGVDGHRGTRGPVPGAPAAAAGPGHRHVRPAQRPPVRGPGRLPRRPAPLVGPPRPGRLQGQDLRGHRVQQLGLRHLRRVVGGRRGRDDGAAVLDPHRPLGRADGNRAGRAVLRGGGGQRGQHREG